VTEPISRTSWASLAPPGYFERVRELCDECHILLISDEVITSFDRWGSVQRLDGGRPAGHDGLCQAPPARTLAGVATTPEVADISRFLASPAASYMTGVTVPAAGVPRHERPHEVQDVNRGESTLI
jgi:NAD(P)-dependent dehydrogenase (short-subunit alcohol dehydrogenase family)